MYRFLPLVFAVLCLAACHTPRPTGDLTDNGTTTRPTAPPAPSALYQLTDDNFAEKMKQGEGLRMVYFTATWCGPCKILGPTVERVSTTYRNQVLIGEMDVDDNYSDAFNKVTTVPTIIFFKNGEEVYRTSGVISESSLELMIDRLL